MSRHGSLRDLLHPGRRSSGQVEIHLVDKMVLTEKLEENKTFVVRDLIQRICKKLDMSPKSVELFGLAQDENGTNWLAGHRKVDCFVKKKLYFLLRFKVFDCEELYDWDKNAFLYYLKQCRNNFRSGKFAHLLNNKVKEMLRMVILEVVLVAKDKSVSLKEIVPKDQTNKKAKEKLDRFLNKEVVLQDILSKNIKESSNIPQSRKIVEKSLERFTDVKKPETDFLIELDVIYKCSQEQFKVKTRYCQQVTLEEEFQLRVHPREGIQWFQLVDGKVFKEIKTVNFQDVLSLDYDKRQSDFQIRLVSVDGPPDVFICSSKEIAESITSLIDGYYRLLVNHNESFFRDLPARKPEFVHGTIDRSTAERILKTVDEPGVYLVRESGHNFGEYIISSFKSQNDIEHRVINFDEESKKLYLEENPKFDELRDLLKYYQLNGNLSESLTRNLRPSLSGPVPLIPKATLGSPELPTTSRGHREPEIVSLNKLQTISLLPKGRYGEASKCKVRGNAEPAFCLKTFKNTEMSKEVFDAFFKCQNDLEHRYVLKLCKVSWPSIENTYCFGFEFMELGPLDSFVLKHVQAIKYGELLNFFCQLADGMNFITKTMELVHGDLTAHNIFVNDGPKGPQIKISDTHLDVLLRKAGLLSDDNMKARCNWYAPEVLNGGPFTIKTDVWAYAMTIWEVLALQIPYGKIDKQSLIKTIDNGMRPSLEVLPYCHEILGKLLNNLWEKNPQERHIFESINCEMVYIKRLEETRTKNKLYYHEFASLRRKSCEESEDGGATYWIGPHGEGISSSDLQMTSSSLSRDSESNVSSHSAEEYEDIYSSVSSSLLEETEFHNTKPRRQKRLFGNGKSTKSSKMPKHEKSTVKKELQNLHNEVVMLRDMSSSRTEGAYNNHMKNEDTGDQLDQQPRFSISELDDGHIQPADLKSKGMPQGQQKDTGTGLALNVETTQTLQVTQIAACDSAAPVGRREREAAFILASIAQIPQGKPEGISASAETDTRMDTTVVDEESPMIIDEEPKNIDLKIEEELHRSVATGDLQTNRPRGVGRPASAPSSNYGDYKSRETLLSEIVTEAGTKVELSTKRSLHRNDVNTFAEEHSQSEVVHFPRNIEVTKQAPAKSIRSNRKAIKEAARKALQGPNAFNIASSLPKTFLPQNNKQQTLGNLPALSNLFNNITVNSSTSDNPIKPCTGIFNILKPPDGRDKFSSPSEQNGNDTSDYQPLILNTSAFYASTSTGKDSATQSSDLSMFVGNNLKGPSPVTSVSSSNARNVPSFSGIYKQNAQRQVQSSVFSDTTSMPNIPQIKSSPLETKPLITSPRHSPIINAVQRLKMAENITRSTATETGKLNTQFLVQSVVPLVPTPNAAAQVAGNNGYTSIAIAKQQPQSILGAQILRQQPAMTDVSTKLTASTLSKCPDRTQPVLIQAISRPTSSLEVRISDLQRITQNKTILPAGSFILTSNNLPPDIKPLVSVNNPLLTTSGQRRVESFSHSLPVTTILTSPQPFTFVTNTVIAEPRPLTCVPKSNQLQTLPVSDNSTFAVGTPDNRTTEPPKIKVEDPYKMKDFISVDPPPLSAHNVRIKEEVCSDNSDFVEDKEMKNVCQVEHSFNIKDARKLLGEVRNLEIFENKDLTLEKAVGKGYYGHVWKGTCHVKGKKEPLPVAVKILNHQDSDQTNTLKEFINEAMNMANLIHSNIVRLYGVVISTSPRGKYDLKLVTEWMPNRSLEGFIFSRKRAMTDINLLKFCHQIAKGMEYLNSRNVVHRDLAARNVLVASMELVKISDFGLSRVFKDGENAYLARCKSGDHKGYWPLRWNSPESITKHVFTSQSDIWSYGVTLWEIFTLRESNKPYARPYEELQNHEIISNLEKGNRLSRPEKCPHDVWNVALNCWKENPDERINFNAIVFQLNGIISSLDIM